MRINLQQMDIWLGKHWVLISSLLSMLVCWIFLLSVA